MAKLGPLKDQEAGLSEFDYLMSEITHIITCLYKFSIAIQHPAAKERLHKIALPDISYLEDLDIRHIDRMFCPMDPLNNFRVARYLSERLGRANTKRRQLLNCYKAQSKETPPYIDDSPSSNEVNYTFKSTSTREGGSVTDSRKTLDPKSATTGYTKMKPQTTVPTINIELSQEDKLEEDEDRRSQSSYASSTSHAVRIRVPPPPTDNAFKGEPFKCSYCFNIIKIRSRKDWKYVGNYVRSVYYMLNIFLGGIYLGIFNHIYAHSLTAPRRTNYIATDGTGLIMNYSSIEESGIVIPAQSLFHKRPYFKSISKQCILN